MDPIEGEGKHVNFPIFSPVLFSLSPFGILDDAAQSSWQGRDSEQSPKIVTFFRRFSKFALPFRKFDAFFARRGATWGFNLCRSGPNLAKKEEALIKKDILTIESLLRPYDVYNNDVEYYDLEADVDSKRKRTDNEETKYEKKQRNTEKEIKEEKDTETVPKSEDKDISANILEDSTSKSTAKGGQSKQVNSSKKRKYIEKTLVMQPIANIRGHTGYLTFARKM